MGPVRTARTRCGDGLWSRPGPACSRGVRLPVRPDRRDPPPPPRARPPARPTSRAATPDMVGRVQRRPRPGQASWISNSRCTTRPAVGEPVEIELELVPTVGAGTAVRALPGRARGCRSCPARRREHFEHPAKGVPVRHKLTVTAEGGRDFLRHRHPARRLGQGVRGAQLFLPAHRGAGSHGAPAAAAAAANVAAPKPTSGQPQPFGRSSVWRATRWKTGGSSRGQEGRASYDSPRTGSLRLCQTLRSSGRSPILGRATPVVPPSACPRARPPSCASIPARSSVKTGRASSASAYSASRTAPAQRLARHRCRRVAAPRERALPGRR